MVIIVMKCVDIVGILVFVYKLMEYVWLDVKLGLWEKFVKCVCMRGDCSFFLFDIVVMWDWKKKINYYFVIKFDCKF